MFSARINCRVVVAAMASSRRSRGRCIVRVWCFKQTRTAS